MANDIFPIIIDDEKIKELYLILQKHGDTIRKLVKAVDKSAAADHDRAIEIINELVEKTEEAISPPPCISRDCVNGTYCHKPQQCDFVRILRDGYKMARVSDDMLPVYYALGWELVSTDIMLGPNSKRNLLIFPREEDNSKQK